jgi:hypothetical protein
MKISQDTFDIMKNFTTINNSIWVNEPKCLKTISVAENIIGIYDTEETFPEWQLYNSVPFMSLVSLFGLNNIDFDFGDKAVVIKSPSVRTTIVYDDIDIIPKLGNLKASTSYKKYDKFDATFSLTSAKIVQIQKAANILGLPDMKVIMRDGKGLITINDEENPDSNLLKMAITGEGECDITMMVKNLQVHGSDYDISVSSGVMSKFQHPKMPLLYVVAAKKE